jgi:hypothetical protein
MAVLLRVRQILVFVGAVGTVFAGVLFLAAALSHRHEFLTAALVAVTAAALGNAGIEGWRAHVLWRSGVWTTLAGRPTSKTEQPTQFKVWLMLHLAFAAVLGAVAAYLAWTIATSNI